MALSHLVPPSPARPADAVARMALLDHDLRAAVADLMGGLRLIPDDGLGPEARLQLDRARASGAALARLMEDRLAPDGAPSELALGAALGDIEARWQGHARERALAFRLVAAGDLPGTVALDHLALDRILSNILSNAVKYTDRGLVQLMVSRSAAGHLRFEVTDEGPGFSPEALARLFEFGGRPAGSAQPGTGLGLHIAHDLTDRLGGSLTVANRAGGGSSVVLDLPPMAFQAAGAVAGPLPRLDRLRILVADDSATQRALLAAMLGQMGAEVSLAADGEAATGWLARADFDLALIDIEMPRLSGIELIRMLRAGAFGRAELPVIAVTAHRRAAEQRRIGAAGADAIMTKPILGPEALAAAVRVALTVDRPSPASGTPGRPLPGIDRLLTLVSPDSGDSLLTALGADLGRVRRSLARARAAGDLAGLQASTHVAIALTGAIGATAPMALAQRLNGLTDAAGIAAQTLLIDALLAQLDGLVAGIADQRHGGHRNGALGNGGQGQ